jgi:CheY-like chemotaxis protein
MKKIMVIDDDPDFVEITRIILESNGYEVTGAYNGEEAMSLMYDEKPNLILLDIMMNQPLDGVEFCKQIQDKPELRKIPIIIISSINHSQISKPVQAQVLLGKVEYYLQRYQN